MTAKNPTHPGTGLRDDLEAVGWSVNEFAARLGVSRNTVSRLLNGRCGISLAVALALERLGWSDADFWLRRQANYDLAQARRAQERATQTPAGPPVA
jgi:addiction module HigA family antidote